LFLPLSGMKIILPSSKFDTNAFMKDNVGWRRGNPRAKFPP
jgi:hypothetical protein